MTEHEAQTKAEKWGELTSRIQQILEEYRVDERKDSRNKEEMYAQVVYVVRLLTKHEIDW